MTDNKIDALVAEYIFGIVTTPEGFVFQPGLGCGTPHKYSTEMSEAWKVVQYIYNSDSWHFELATDQGELNDWVCTFENLKTGERWQADAPSAPLAICIAALKTKGVELKGLST